MNPVDHPEIFETVTIAGVTWSGIATIGGLAYEMGWDIKDADGENGASLSRKGRKLSTFTIRFDMIYDPIAELDQFEEWYNTWVPLLKSCFVGADPVGLVIQHPDAQALELDSVVVEKIGQVQRDPVDYGLGYVDVSLIQYAPAREVSTSGPAKSKGKSSGTGDGGDDGIDHDDPIQQRTDKLNELLDGP